MPTNYQKTMKREEKRINDLLRTFNSGEEITPADVFNSKEIPEILNEKPISYLTSFNVDDTALPLNCMLYPRTIVSICSKCDCNSNPELIKPFLERKLILPVLSEGYENYNPNLMDILIQYPHIGFPSLWLLRVVQFSFTPEKEPLAVCPHCFKEKTNEILKDLSQKSLDKKQKSSLESYLKRVLLPKLNPPRGQDADILFQVMDAVNQNNWKLLRLLGREADLVNTFRVANIFSAIPQVNQQYLEDTIKILGDLKITIPQDIAEEIENKEWLVESLNIGYNPEIPIEEYLDIIVPRRKRINSLVSELVSTGIFNKQLNDEIWKINQEISSSKSLETLDFLTSFTSNNASMIFSVLTGALIGYMSGDFIGCGLGGIGGLTTGIAGKIVSKYQSFKIPRYPRKTIEWIKARIEGPEQRLLSLILAKKTKTIQVWGLRKKMKKK